MSFQNTKTVQYIVLHGVKNKNKRKEEIFNKENEANKLFESLVKARNVHVDMYRKTIVRTEAAKGNMWDSKYFYSDIEEKTFMEKLS